MKFRSQLVIHLDHLKYNFEQIKKIAPQNKVLFMVKADGYGHGMLAITRYAVTELGITEFGCATLFEAITLREELKDLEFDIFVFSDTHITDLEAVQVYLEKRIIPVIADLNSLEFFTKHSDFKNIPLVLKINTGLNRLGFSMDEVDKIKFTI
jgi:alanine racemase